MSCLVLTGCSTGWQYRQEAHERGWERRVVAGEAFDHVVFIADAAKPEARLHVYIEGDGSPIRALEHDPPDPTPENGLMWDLMELDPAPRIYLGRPGYLGAAADWNAYAQERYSEEVVASMVSALRSVALRGQSLVLFGHSGGGTLALLMAEDLPEVVAIVTVAGNLDVAAWTRHYGDAPLSGSLDPAERLERRRKDVVEIHAVGGRDSAIPPALSQKAALGRSGAELRLYPENSHTRGWKEDWPALLEEVRARMSRDSGS